jgi:hypothetical protein
MLSDFLANRSHKAKDHSFRIGKPFENNCRRRRKKRTVGGLDKERVKAKADCEPSGVICVTYGSQYRQLNVEFQ